MIKNISNFIDKLLWPKRVACGLPCNKGLWWFIPPIMQALGAVGGAIGSAIGSGASAIGSALGIGGSAAVPLGSAAAQSAGFNAASQAMAAKMGAGFAAGSGTAAGSAAASNAALGLGGGGLKGIAKLAINELTPFGAMLDPEKSMGDKLSSTAIGMAKSEQGSKTPPAPIYNYNDFQGSSPNVLEQERAPMLGEKKQQRISPEMIEEMLKLKQQYSSGPIGRGY